MADPLDSQNIARRSFGVSRRGYEQQEVRAFLHEVSALVERLQREAGQLRERAQRAEARLGLTEELDDGMLMEILGEETTRVLTSAREAAAEIRAKADAAAERIIGDATSEAAERRADAVREADGRRAEATAESESLLASARAELDRRRAEADDAAARIREAAAEEAQALRDEGQRDLDRIREEGEEELAAARERGRDMVAEAQAVRERVLRDLAVRRKKARQQVEKLNAGRERLLQAYDVVRRTIDEATDELSTSLSDARLAADAAARRIAEEPDPTLEQLDDEVTSAGLVDLPITAVGDGADEGEDPGPFSGEVPAVVVEEPVEPVEPVDPEAAGPVSDPPAAEPGERRGRKGRRRKETFEGLPPAAFSKVEPPAEGEGIRILADATAAEPEPAEVAPSEAAEPEPDPGAGPPTAAAEDVFARLRAERGAPEEDDGARDGAAVEPDATTDTDAEPASDAGSDPEAVDEAPTAFSARDTALAPIDKDLARRLKRALADEQNDVLDKLRRAKPKGVDDLVPAPDDHAGRWAEIVTGPLTDAASAGATWAGGTPGSTTDLADELARSLTAPLRERIDRSFVASDGNLDDVADRVRALYREWKGQRLTDTSRHYAIAAYARGVYDGLPPGVAVRWVIDPAGGPCPDCEDNVLAGALSRGSEFPTGHPCAPAHPGCQCLVLATDA